MKKFITVTYSTATTPAAFALYARHRSCDHLNTVVLETVEMAEWGTDVAKDTRCLKCGYLLDRKWVPT